MVFTLSVAALIVLLVAAVFMAARSREKCSSGCECLLKKNDIITVCGLCILSALLLFSSLGENKAPESVHNITEKSVAFAFDTPTQLDYIMIYPTGNSVNGIDNILVSFSDESGEVSTKSVTDFNVYSWYPLSINKKVSKLVFHNENGNVTIGEIGFIAGEKILNVDSSKGTVFVSGEGGFEPADYETGLFDEQNLVPINADYMNGMYFDEIFHSRTAKEYIDSETAYEWTHPPLGKIIISAGVRAFGMNPFGWRFMSALFGTLSVAAIYIFAKLVTGSSMAAFLAGALTVFDFMHHVQSRIGTVDVFLVFFIMLMYMFLYVALQKERVRYLPLLFSGISFGLAFSVKWSAAYAVLGIGILLLLRILRKQEEKGERIKLVCFSAFVFALIPLCIYILSYIPFVSADGKTGFAAIVENQMKILSYHGVETVGLEHDFSSMWYSWPLDIKPVMYYSAWDDACTVGAVSVFGNPVIWWTGVVCIIANVYFAFKKDKNALFLLIGYFSNLLPWALISRSAYIYHYFPSTVFMILMIVNCFVHLININKRLAYGIFVTLLIVSIFVFFMFLPATRAVATEVGYFDGYLEWLPSWKLYI